MKLNITFSKLVLPKNSIIARNKGLRVLKEQEIWDAAMQVWDELPSCKIARGFVQVYRLAQKVVKANGVNGFLRSKGKEGLHCGVAGDFIDTPDGIKRRDGKKFNWEWLPEMVGNGVRILCGLTTTPVQYSLA